jgi:hypothetical protein
MDYEKKLAKAIEHAEKVKLKQELHELRHANDKPKDKIPTGKIGFWFMIINCTIIEIYSLIAMFIFEDLSPLTTLILAVVGDCIAFISYNIKSGKENTVGGIVYESAMKKLEYELENNNTDDSVG